MKTEKEQILYVVTVEPERQSVTPSYQEDQKIFSTVSGRPCHLINYRELPEWFPKLKPGWVVVQSGGRADPEFPNEPVLEDLNYRALVDWQGPQLAICRSFQLVSALYGAEVRPMPHRRSLQEEDAGFYETGVCNVQVEKEDPLFEGLPGELQVLQRHRNEVVDVPEGFVQLAQNKACPLQAWKHKERMLYGTQFHPERGGLVHGLTLLNNFFRLGFGDYKPPYF